MQRALNTVAALVVTGLVIGVVWYLVAPGADQGDVASAGGSLTPFAGDGALQPGPVRGWYSTDGARLAVVNAGRIDIAIEGQLVPITPRSGNVVDAAWFGGGEALLVGEGP